MSTPENLMDTPLILASASPRRRQLLERAGYRFAVQPAPESVEHIDGSGLSPRELVGALAFRKARFVARQHDQALILAADTVAECRGTILGKPRDRDHAREMLTRLRGQPHFVHTGICLWNRPDDQKRLETDSTELVMARLSDRQLEDYLDSGLWQGKAGAYGYQDDPDWVRITRGSESNVVGLPMELLSDMLSDLGSPPPGG